MQRSDTPNKFPIPFADSATVPTFRRAIPEASQIGIQAGAASLTDGFPPVTFDPLDAGGIPPFGQDFNGLLNQITLWSQWQAAGGMVVYDAAFSSDIGGYPLGAVLAATIGAGKFWISTADNNTTDPDAGGANWLAIGGPIAAARVMANLTGSSAPATPVTLPALATAMGFATTLGGEWSITFPGGLIKKGGLTNVVGAGSLATQSFATPFPTSCFTVTVSYANSLSPSQATGGNPHNATPIDETGFRIFNGGTNPSQYYWEATGV